MTTKLSAAVLIFCIWNSSLYSQRRTNDSLVGVLSKNTQTDTNKVNQLLGLSYLYYLSKPDTAIHLALEALALSQKLRYVEGEATSYTYLGNVYSVLGNSAKAMQMDLKSLALHEKINDQRGIASDISHIGVDYLKRNEPDIALDYFFRAKMLVAKHGDTARDMIVSVQSNRAKC